MEITFKCLAIIIAAFMAGFTIGNILGKMETKGSSSKKIKNETFYIVRQCNIYLQNTSSMLSRMIEIKVFYKKDKIISNDCTALMGKNCKYTKEKCHFL